MNARISNVSTDTFSRNYLPGEQPMCCRCLEQVGIDKYHPAVSDGTAAQRQMPGYKMASCSLLYAGMERHAVLCAACHKAVLAAEEDAAEAGPCHCSRCGAERDAYSWSKGRKSAFGLCYTCFARHVQTITDVINTQQGPLPTLLAMVTGDFEPKTPASKPTAATQERSWAYLMGQERPIRYGHPARGQA